MQTIHNKYSLVIDNSDLNYEHVVQLTQAFTYHLHLHTPDIPTNKRSFVQTHPTYNPSTPAGKYINKIIN